MAIFTIQMGQYSKLAQEIFKYVMLFIIFHLLLNMNGIKNLGIFSPHLFNNEFLMFLLILGLTIAIYYLIVVEIVEII